MITVQVTDIAECSLGAFCNTFDLHLAIIGLENQFLVYFWVATLDSYYCKLEIHPLWHTYLYEY